VVKQGLILLEKLGMLETRLAEPGNAQKLQIRLLPQNASKQDNIAERLEYATFQQALKEVGKFRGWLLKSPLATMKTTLMSSSSLSSAFMGLSPATPDVNPEPLAMPNNPAPQVMFN